MTNPSSTSAEQPTDIYTIVLAGGKGQRMRPFIEGWLGEARPKQFCQFYGNASMLGQSIDRAKRFSEEARLITVITSGQETHLNYDDVTGQLVIQPTDRGTLSGILLALSIIRRQSPGPKQNDARVLLLPADHFIAPEAAFEERAMEALDALKLPGVDLVLLAADADKPETDYGWIAPGESRTRAGIADVCGFHEKPDAPDARRFFERNYLWNTMITAFNFRPFWSALSTLHPETIKAFDDRIVRPTHLEAHQIEKLYSELSSLDLSKDVIEHLDNVHVHALNGVQWSDWGRPERVLETLDANAFEPAFPRELIYSRPATAQ